MSSHLLTQHNHRLTPVSAVASRLRLRSANRHQLIIMPRCRLSTYGSVQVPIPTVLPTAPTPTNVTLLYACMCENNVTVCVRRSQGCNLSLFLTL